MTEKENVAVSHPTGVLEISENNFRVGSIKEFVELWEFSASYFLIKEMDLYVLRIACGMKSCKFGQNALALLRDVNGKNGRQLPFTGIGKLLRTAVNKKAFSFNENGMPTKVVNAECWGVDLDDFADVLMVMGFAIPESFRPIWGEWNGSPCKKWVLERRLQTTPFCSFQQAISAPDLNDVHSNPYVPKIIGTGRFSTTATAKNDPPVVHFWDKALNFQSENRIRGHRPRNNGTDENESSVGGGKKKIVFYRRLTNPPHFSKGLLYSKQISSTVATDLPTSSKNSENISEIKTVEQPLIVEDFGAQVGEKVNVMSEYQSFCREIQEWAETFQNEVSE